MGDTVRENRKVLGIAGIVVVLAAMTLAAIGMTAAIRQNREMASLRAYDLRREAVPVAEAVVRQANAGLEELLAQLSSQAGRRPTSRSLRLGPSPAWVQMLVVLQSRGPGEQSLQAWKPGPNGEWQPLTNNAGDDARLSSTIAADLAMLVSETNYRPTGSGIRYGRVEENGRPCAFAATSMGIWGGRVAAFAAVIDSEKLVAEAVDPQISSERIQVQIGGAEPKYATWTVTLAPLAPFVRLLPNPEFVDEQFASARRQSTFFIAGTLLTVVSLAAVLWGMWRVFNRELALSRMKQAFVADVSHELKTPLALIRMFGETLLEGRVPDEERKRGYYEIITRESTRLTHMINNILDFARVDAGKKTYRMERTNVASVVKDTYEAYRTQLDHESFYHALHVEDDLPEVFCDRDAVSQALINLITNAVKYSDDEKSLDIHLTQDVRRGQRGVLISVSDRGIGIKPEHRAHLFSGFYRAEDERVRRKRGAGLGLALVKHIVDSHGGIIDVESRLVKGTTFRIFLPQNEQLAVTEESTNGPHPDR